MSYQADPMQDQYIRNRIRDILQEKVSDRTYKGSQIVGGQSVGGARKKKPRKRVYKRKTVAKRKRSLMFPMEYMGGYKVARPKNPNKVMAGRQGAKHNPWIVFYSEWSAKNAARLHGMSGRDRAKLAAQDYHIWQSSR